MLRTHVWRLQTLRRLAGAPFSIGRMRLIFSPDSGDTPRSISVLFAGLVMRGQRLKAIRELLSKSDRLPSIFSDCVRVWAGYTSVTDDPSRTIPLSQSMQRSFSIRYGLFDGR